MKKLSPFARISWIIAAILAVITALSVALSPARAQTAPAGTCNGDGAIIGQFFLTPDSGPAGSTTVLSGSTQLFPHLQEDGPVTSVAQEGPPLDAWWLDASGGATYLGPVPTVVDDQTLILTFSFPITVPAGAATGGHSVAFGFPQDSDPACLAFTVTEPSVGEDGYGQSAITSLPSTGVAIALPAVASAIAGIAVLSGRARRRR